MNAETYIRANALFRGAPHAINELSAKFRGSDVPGACRSNNEAGGWEPGRRAVPRYNPHSHIEDFDAAIAAQALAIGATLVTANIEHMTRIPGLRIEDWETDDRRT